MAKTGADSFTLAEIISDLRTHGSTYAASTIRTMTGSHLNSEASGSGIARYRDVRRIDRGRYKLIQP